MGAGLNKLTDKKLRALHGASSEKPFKMSDGAGLMIRVTAKGAISWAFKYRLGGRESEAIVLTLGRYPDMSLKQAREVRDRCRTWLAEGKDPKMQFNLTMEESLKPVTVKEAIEYWIHGYAEENRANVERHKAQLQKHIYPYIGNMALADCETRYWLQCFDRMKKEAPVAAGYVFQMCKQALKFCRVRRYAVSNALDDLTIPDVGKKQRKKDRVLSDIEAGDLWAAILAGDRFMPYYTHLLKIITVFGCRSQEARLSTWQEWDRDAWIWTVPKEHSKGGEKIVRPVPETLRPFIEQLYEDYGKSGLLLGTEKNVEAVSQWGRGVYKKLGHSEAWTLHDLRRTLSTGMNNMGIAPHVVEQLLGHSMPGVMAIYNRSLYLPEKLDALNKWVERLDVLAGGHENVVLLQGSRTA
ncbi:site-specific integrase [Pectobacterium quasiaquaticum]|uniref:tyrosine-type recombinase/integrase n=1 Tax=Pectobacterium quasiaquaticum TaxID=2774015 RepID=UPI001873DF0D|nr:site-specific integrase [Pectobacterium quasiaquaticum]URG53028.1 site-specific integrase [Pectobacterium quasiaquaticum]